MKGCTTAGVLLCEPFLWQLWDEYHVKQRFPGKEKQMIRVNGEEKKLDKPTALLTYLVQEGYQTGRIAVELNGTIIPKRNYEQIILHAGDVLEVVSFVGGG